MKIYSIFLLILVLQSLIAFTQPKGIHLSWNGKNEVKTSTTMSITWMDDKKGEGLVHYGTGIYDLTKISKAEVKYSNELASYVYKVTLINLQPATYYYYKVGSDYGWSGTSQFRTGPKEGDRSKIVVGVWSDTQNNSGNLNFEQTDSIVNAMTYNHYYFTIHNGDIVEKGSIADSWKKLFQVTQPMNDGYPFMSALGNHDVQNADTIGFQKPFPVYYQLFNLPNDQLNYSYNYGNTHFISINSGYAQFAEKKGKVLFAKNSDEYRWLEADLKKAKANKNIRWIILYCHYPVYSFGGSHIPTWQKHLKPLIDKYQIDLCLAGHRHVYERHKEIRGTNIFEPAGKHLYKNPKGTIYVTNGSCGGSLQNPGGHDLPTMIFTPKEKMYTYAMMTIEDRTLSYRVFNKQREEIDHFKIVK